MDAFEIRLQFLAVLRKLTSSQTSINRVAAFAIKHGPRCADDLWDCLLEECTKASINARMNIFYALDSLLEQSTSAGLSQYGQLIKRDLARIVDLVVPETREGILNVLSVLQVLRSWRTKRVIDADTIGPVEQEVLARRKRPHAAIEGSVSSSGFSNFSRNDIFRRIEDDRERHKRLRERIWVLPPPPKIVPLGRPTSLIPSPASPASPQRAPAIVVPVLPSAIDLEFEQLWENNHSLTVDELRLIKAEASRIEVG